MPEVSIMLSKSRTGTTESASLALLDRACSPPSTSPFARSRGAPASSASPHCSWPAAAFKNKAASVPLHPRADVRRRRKKKTSRALLNTLVAALCVDRRRHAHMQVFGERVELGLLARAARGLAEATLARTGKPPHLELPEAPSPAKRVVRHDLAHQAYELHLGAHHIAGRNVSQHPPPERVSLLVLGSRRGEALELMPVVEARTPSHCRQQTIRRTQRALHIWWRARAPKFDR